MGRIRSILKVFCLDRDKTDKHPYSQTSDIQNENNSLPLVNVPVYDTRNQNSTNPMTKFSYDIISVREPLAKILAERQQNINQIPILTEHEYIEVYGERGSSCFYEEIAGSTTSSATYDQIGAISNHNYQVLVNQRNDEQQPMPLYSKINKLTRRTSAISQSQASQPLPPSQPNCETPDQNYSTISKPSIAKPNQNVNSNGEASDAIHTNNETHIPTPPPRYTRQSIYNLNTNRPLPLPENFNRNIRDINETYSKETLNDRKTETDSNGYELLTNPFDDDQIDVGYERIRDTTTDRQSSFRQIYNLKALENGGYEIVQPIYSSPSNPLTEPNYEAITPIKASELAASATARLNAVLKQDQ